MIWCAKRALPGLNSARLRRRQAAGYLPLVPACPDADWTVTARQSAVLSDGEVCLGRGVMGAAQIVYARGARARAQWPGKAADLFDGRPEMSIPDQNGISSSMSSNPLDGLDAAGAGWRAAGGCCWRGGGALGRDE